MKSELSALYAHMNNKTIKKNPTQKKINTLEILTISTIIIILDSVLIFLFLDLLKTPAKRGNAIHWDLPNSHLQQLWKFKKSYTDLRLIILSFIVLGSLLDEIRKTISR
jgi:hypothetical protein